MDKTLKEQFADTKPGDVGIIGDPIHHSLSPHMQNAAMNTWLKAFNDREIPAPFYHRFQVKKEELGEAIQLVKDHGLRGINVTVPHKIEVCQFIDQLDSFAKRVGSVNTIQSSGNKLTGHNTDADGFQRALLWDLEFDPENKTALILGAGGTGRVIAFALLDMGIGKVFIWNRSQRRLQEIINNANGNSHKIVLVNTADELMKANQSASLIVNATSVGLQKGDPLPVSNLKFNSHQVVFDVIYNHETQFIMEAKKAGAKVCNGLGMLVYQGARSFEIWTGVPAPIDVMKSVLTKQLQGE